MIGKQHYERIRLRFLVDEQTILKKISRVTFLQFSIKKSDWLHE
jgi:hypothetical protein